MISPRIVVIGLGYVGLPLAVALARKFDVTGFDTGRHRVEELARGIDRTREVSGSELAGTAMTFTSDPQRCVGADVYIVTVPTPVDENNEPDLRAVLAATRMVASAIDPARRPTIVYESTVYPGVTEEICGPEIERVAGLSAAATFASVTVPNGSTPATVNIRSID
jgi:UDP-N-acetyl-D-mannosaminuronate dehydrogenase